MGSYKNLQLQYEKMRTLVLRDYDKAWIVEHDMIVPEDALKKLLEVEADVVTGYYQLRHGADKSNIFPLNGRTFNTKETIQPVGGGAMGCVLVDKKVFEGFSFLLESPGPPDGAFMQHCRGKRFKQIARLDVRCGHIRPDGVVLWPQ